MDKANTESVLDQLLDVVKLGAHGLCPSLTRPRHTASSRSTWQGRLWGLARNLAAPTSRSFSSLRHETWGLVPASHPRCFPGTQTVGISILSGRNTTPCSLGTRDILYNPLKKEGESVQRHMGVCTTRQNTGLPHLKLAFRLLYDFCPKHKEGISLYLGVIERLVGHSCRQR